jgi:hypothetical protein
MCPSPVRRLRAQLHRFSREHVFMVEEPLFYSMDGATLGKDLLKVLCRIAREKGRVEITNCDGSSCVMISKDELDLIESALEILSNLHEVQLLHDKVKHVLTLDDETQPVPAVRLQAAEQAG